MIPGILGGQTPVIIAMARHSAKDDGDPWAVTKRRYRWLNNERITSQDLFASLYQIGRHAVALERPTYPVVAIDPVNFEKPYAQEVEGVSGVHKATPPDLNGQARLTHGYPAITATSVNTPVPVTRYAHWFSYQTADFLSQTHKIEHAVEQTGRLYPNNRRRFVGDAGLDDQKMFAKVADLNQEFIFRVCHRERLVEVYHDRLQRWETEKLGDLTACMPSQATFHVRLTHAGPDRLATVHFGGFKLRLPATPRAWWSLVADDQPRQRQWVLITPIPLVDLPTVQPTYHAWRLRTRIEPGDRLDQAQGVGVEDRRVPTVARRRRLFAMVLLATQLVWVMAVRWPPKAALWRRQLGGKLNLPSDRDGPYWLLQGIASVITTCMSLSFACLHPFPFQEFTCG